MQSPPAPNATHGFPVEPVRVLVIGAGGHARVCIEALLDMPGRVVVGCITKNDETVPAPLPGIAIIGIDANLESVIAEHSVTHAFVAVTNNRVRASVIRRCADLGLPLADAVSRGAYVSSSSTIGSGVLLAAGAVVNSAARLGAGVIVNTNASVGHDCIVGEASHIGPGVAMGGTVMIGDQVLVGVGARVVPGMSIGDGAVIGAGSVVTRDVPPGAVMVGNPARRVQRP
ncbi:MAG: sugar O-acyltransferase, sialic acid O-acetyltransferase NeuD family protein [Ilumatobacteraceae bacterium]|nr:sugar O-acyltransferase, sialic acid O-acetyltransferase NeuD family protein [Ilumatobacteraceae bacterium]